ncbi:MAG: hypothetical protein J2P59_12885, partial [Acidimicrobiales bacterium]|nr:hypothetical protein [Acidimicrobiales bacterium]
GVGLLSPLGLAGAAAYVVGHGLVKAALFLCVGIVLHRLGSVNERFLHGRARHLRVAGVIFSLAGLGLADLPPFATFLGKGWIEESGVAHGMAWLTGVALVTSILVGGAVLRVAGGVFYGLGDAPEADPRMAEEASEETSETEEAKERTPLSMILPPAVLVLVALGVTFVPHLGPAIQHSAVRFQDQRAYSSTVLSGVAAAHVSAPLAPEDTGITVADVATGAGSALGSLLLAAVALYWRRLPLVNWFFTPRAGPRQLLERLQSGLVADYVTWIVIGTACLGGALAFSIK